MDKHEFKDDNRSILKEVDILVYLKYAIKISTPALTYELVRTGGTNKGERHDIGMLNYNFSFIFTLVVLVLRCSHTPLGY